MEPDRFQAIQQIFRDASACPPEDRVAFLDEACGSDDDLRREVESLLGIHDVQTANFLEEPALGDATGLPPTPQTIGRYHIRQPLGEGGFAIVYLAEQTEPVRRKVAVKVIKPGMDSRQVLTRFEAERHALALMDHPNVAGVLDAGTTDSGHPYFVMEYVAGEPITDYCDRHRLGNHDRLDLFIQTCEAIQHAHHKGIIHRDVKPSNVLVTVREGKPLIKVIDFGIAKAISQPLTERTLFTEQGQLIGTPEYMSPEQAEMRALDIDTRTDIYSLGVLLYQLLVGVLPFDPATLRQAAFGEIQRIIREQEPPKPSTKLSTLGEGTAATARQHDVDPRTLMRELQGDLDWITMKALAKDRTRRYETAAGFAEDIQRYLRKEPVIAGPPGAGYRIRKFVSRNRGGVAAAAIVLFVLAAGMAGTTWGWWTATKAKQAEATQRGLADTRRIEADEQRAEADRQREEAQRQAAIAEAVNAFLNDDLLSAAIPQALGRDATVLQVLDAASANIDGRFADQPIVEATIRSTLGNSYGYLGEADAALPHMERALALLRQELGDEHSDTLSLLNSVATAYRMRGEYDRSETLFTTTLETCRRTLGSDDPGTLALISNLAYLRLVQGHYEDSKALYTESYEGRRALYGDEDPDTLRDAANLAMVNRAMGNYDIAEAMAVDALETSTRAHGREHPDTLHALIEVTSVYTDQGKFQTAEPLAVESLEILRRVMGNDHPGTTTAMTTLGRIYLALGRLDEAEPLFVEALEASRRHLGDDHPDTIISMNNLATFYSDARRFDEAETLLAEALERATRVMGEGEPFTLNVVNSLATLYNHTERFAEAVPLYLQVLESRQSVYGEGHISTLTTLNNLAMAYKMQEQYDEAEPYMVRMLEIAKASLGEDHPGTLTITVNVAGFYRDTGDNDEAETLYLKALAGLPEVYGPTHNYVQLAKRSLATVYINTDRYNDAERLLLEARDVLTQQGLNEEDEDVRKVDDRLAEVRRLRDATDDDAR